LGLGFYEYFLLSEKIGFSLKSLFFYYLPCGMRVNVKVLLP
jgi:hypothetical protein